MKLGTYRVEIEEPGLAPVPVPYGSALTEQKAYELARQTSAKHPGKKILIIDGNTVKAVLG